MEDFLELKLKGKILKGNVHLPASKSECNRAIIISALSGNRVSVENISNAEDTKIMLECLQAKEEVLNVGDAGTAMRFLTAFFAFRNRDVILTGSERMKQRPIAPLVQALNSLGADIHCLEKDGFPPLAVYGRNAHFRENKVSILSDVSSQFISALMMIAPTLPDGLIIELTGEKVSESYSDLTLKMMSRCGIKFEKRTNNSGNTEIEILPQPFSETILKCSADWSSASYFYFLVAHSPGSEIFLEGLSFDSDQPDKIISEWMKPLGVESISSKDGIRLKYSTAQNPSSIQLDFKNCPDLAQGMIVFLAIKGISADITGLETLSLKETDRVLALENELKKFEVKFYSPEKGKWKLEGKINNAIAEIETYGDHRMAMAFAQLGFVLDSVKIQNPSVVKKSFPTFWEELEGVF